VNAQVCPYCRVGIDLTTAEALLCEGCHTPHHADCYTENGGCTIFGCLKAPVEAPKIEVSMPEVRRAALAQSQYLPGTQAPRPAPDPKTDGVQVFLNEAYRPNKSRVTYALLGFFLGFFGVHNFYAGYARRGVFQLSLTLFSFFYLALASWLWALVEICIVKTDGDGLAFN
jgi:TM2 domain-containing membrane protein YozV